jgi:hypothetical protein
MRDSPHVSLRERQGDDGPGERISEDLETETALILLLGVAERVEEVGVSLVRG